MHKPPAVCPRLPLPVQTLQVLRCLVRQARRRTVRDSSDRWTC